MHNRLKQFLAAENVTQAQFAATIGIGKANISHVLSGRNKPGYDFIRAIMVGYPHLNINWLLIGSGKMYDMDEYNRDRPTPDGTILFQSDEIQEETTDFAAAPIDISSEDIQNIPLLDSITELDKPIQHTDKQRKVSKIIILFDDGSFQEM